MVGWLSVYALGAAIGATFLGSVFFVPSALGAGSGGIVAGSVLASIQGPAVTAGSWFAYVQALGATGWFTGPVVAAAAAGGAGIGALAVGATQVAKSIGALAVGATPVAKSSYCAVAYVYTYIFKQSITWCEPATQFRLF